jgi:hypothetical protein
LKNRREALLEQRLYLAEKFMSQALHQRFVDDLAKALPIDAKRPDNVRAILRNAANGLIQKQAPPCKHSSSSGNSRRRREHAAWNAPAPC